MTDILATEDAIGLYRLDQLYRVEEMEDYIYGNSGYWLASPYPGDGMGDSYICCVLGNGDVSYDRKSACGVRPVICLSSNIQFSDENDDGALEINVVQQD